MDYQVENKSNNETNPTAGIYGQGDLMSNNIILYDGDCGLCNRSVQFVLKYERSPQIKFSTLQSSFSKDLFTKNNYPQPDLTTFYFFTDNQLYKKSRAAFKVIPFLKWYWQPLRLFSILPIPFTDFIYDFIARHRKRIGGTFCIFPSAENRKRFIS